MLSMSMGPFAVSIFRVLTLFAFVVALLVGLLSARSRRVAIADTLITFALIDVIVARGIFVIRYFPQFHHDLLGMFDIRDGGFDVVGGLAVAGLYAGWMIWKRPRARVPLLSALFAGALTWGLTGGGILLITTQDQVLPDVRLRTMDGQPVTLDALAQKHPDRPIVVNLWASWCPPCRREMPLLAAAQRRHPHITFLFVDQGESAAAVAHFLRTRKLPRDHVLLDFDQKLGQRAYTHALPTTLFYGDDRRLVDRQLGELSRATLTRALDRFNTAQVPARDQKPL